MNQKSKLNSGKKGYLQIDFIFAFMIFLFFLLNIFTYYKTHKNVMEDSFEETRLQAEARDICFLLIKNPGKPTNWENNISSLTFTGLKSESENELDANKISNFSNSSYFTIANSYDLKGFVYITIKGLITNSTYLEFGSLPSTGKISRNYQCYSRYNNETVEVLVEAWK